MNSAAADRYMAAIRAEAAAQDFDPPHGPLTPGELRLLRDLYPVEAEWQGEPAGLWARLAAWVRGWWA